MAVDLEQPAAVEALIAAGANVNAAKVPHGLIGV